jgi:hypothetical protein
MRREAQREAGAARHLLQQRQGGVDHLDADAVAGQNTDVVLGFHRWLSAL